MTNIYKHSIGISIAVSTGIDLTLATKTAFLIKKPSGRTMEWVTTVTDESTGAMSYTTVEGDLNEDGWYYGQSYVEFTGKVLYGKPVKFKVYDAFEVQ